MNGSVANDPKRTSSLDVAVVGEAIIEGPVLPDGAFHLRARSLCNPLKSNRSAPVAKKVPKPIDVHVGSRVRIRRLALGMSQEKLGNALGLTFQQVQKYEKGTNRIGASRLQHVSLILQVAIAYFFEGTPGQIKAKGNAPSSAFVSDFVTSTEGLTLAKAFTQIKDAKVRHHIVKLVGEIAGG
jgi:transcriptional regulator with XRE-family HTH domain